MRVANQGGREGPTPSWPLLAGPYLLKASRSFGGTPFIHEPLLLLRPFQVTDTLLIPPHPQTHTCTQGCVLKRTKNAFATPTEAKFHGDTLCFMVKTWARHKTTEPVLNNGRGLAAGSG